jgi:tetratricopeptide (TPR) repeat protein
VGVLQCLGAIAACATIAAPASSCINTFEPELLYSLEQRDAEAARITQELEKAHARKPTLENSNDLGVALLLSGRTDEAVALFRETEKKFPDSARVAANLGSALELQGKYDEALEWIREGIVRDVSLHKGSEWLHERVLKARVVMPYDPKWFDRESVIGLDFGDGEVPVAPEILPFEKGKLKGAQDLLRQVDYQLLERTKYSKPPDPVIGNLFASGGDLVIASGLSLLDGGTEDAKRYYESALEYGAPRADLVRKRLARYESDLAKMPPPKPKEEEEVAEYPTAVESLESSGRMFTIFVAAAFVLAIGGIIVHMLRRRGRKTPR